MSEETKPRRAEIMLFAADGINKPGVTPIGFRWQEDDLHGVIDKYGQRDAFNLRTFVDPGFEALAVHIDDAPFTGIYVAAHGSPFGTGMTADFGFGDADEEEASNEGIVEAIADAVHTPDFVVLSACESLDLGEMLVKHVPFVVAFSGKLKIHDAGRFDRAFMKILVQGGTLDAAFRAGKRAVSLRSKMAGNRIHRLRQDNEKSGKMRPFDKLRALPDPEVAPVYVVGGTAEWRAVRRLRGHLYPTHSCSSLFLDVGKVQPAVSKAQIDGGELFPILVCPTDAGHADPAFYGADRDGGDRLAALAQDSVASTDSASTVDDDTSADDFDDETADQIEEAAREVDDFDWGRRTFEDWMRADEVVGLIQKHGHGSRVPFFPVLVAGASLDEANLPLRTVVPLKVDSIGNLAPVARRLEQLLARQRARG